MVEGSVECDYCVICYYFFGLDWCGVFWIVGYFDYCGLCYDDGVFGWDVYVGVVMGVVLCGLGDDCICV